MDRKYIAALIRGMCINLTGKSLIVVSQTGAEFYEGAMKVDIPQDKSVAQESEESIACILHNAYDSWRESINTELPDGEVLLPSCIVVNEDVNTSYWIDKDLDSAQKRMTQKNVTPIKEKVLIPKTIVQMEDRANIVKNKITLVTGGAQGIGEEIARNFAAAGALVFIADLNIKGAEKLAGKINEEEKRNAAIAVSVNVTDEKSVEAMFNYILQQAGGLDICISNAGVLRAGSVLEQELSDFKFVTDINYTAFFTICKYSAKIMLTQHLTAPNRKTDIIQINSKSGLEGSNKNGAYSGGKFGSLGLVESFALELVEYGIKVNAVCPGNFLDSPLWSDPDNGLFVQYLKTGKVPGAKSIKDVRTFYELKVPMKRGCDGRDLLRAIYYIIEQEYETGQAVPVTGGQIMLH
nr:KR domain [uncultured bacterium]